MSDVPVQPPAHEDVRPTQFPLLTCPKCDYSLTGLPPAPYRCPECGLEYDEYSCEWISLHPWLRYAKKVVPLCLIGASVFCVFLYYSCKLGPLSLLNPIFIFVEAIAVFLILGKRFREGARISFLPNGIYIRELWWRKFYPWSKIPKAEVFDGWATKGIRLYKRKVSVLTEFWLYPKENTHENRELLARVIQEAKRRYSRNEKVKK